MERSSPYVWLLWTQDIFWSISFYLRWFSNGWNSPLRAQPVCVCVFVLPNQVLLTTQPGGSRLLLRNADWFDFWPRCQQIWQPLAGVCVSGWRMTPGSRSAVIESLSLCLKTAWQELVVDIIGWHAAWKIEASSGNSAEGVERSKLGLGYTSVCMCVTVRAVVIKSK